MSHDEDTPTGREPTDARIPEGEGRGVGEAAGHERASREWEETYGRGGGSAFGDAAWRRTLGRPGVVPGGTDWRVALRAYVAGHDRGRDAAAKLADAARAAGGSALPAREGAAEPAPTPEAERWEGATAGGVRSTYGVPIPERLDFHRGAGTWRRRLPWVRIEGRDADVGEPGG
ncbi:MAG TPA: hypothetical protein VKA44_02030 [Gemmatimonadota bacterium]|nr:hypothetical protein [Gemmatimonadota bacterium]